MNPDPFTYAIPALLFIVWAICIFHAYKNGT